MLTDLQVQKITKFFSMYDANCDGYLVSDDFELVVKRLADLKNLGSRSGKYIALKDRFRRAWKSLESHADLNHDHQVSLQEWISYYDKILGDEKAYDEELHTLMDIVFEAFDNNGDGKICREEWEHLFTIYNICPIYADKVFEKLDLNGDGYLDRSEVMNLIHRFFYSDDEMDVANRMFGPY